MKYILFLTVFVVLLGQYSCMKEKSDSILLYQVPEFSLYSDSVRQGEFSAFALSSNEIHSNYLTESRELSFKISIKGQDDELPAFVNHEVLLYPENGELTIDILFGKKITQTTPLANKNPFLESNTLVQFRLDMRAIRDSIREKQRYIAADGTEIHAEDLKSITLIGSKHPLKWDNNEMHKLPEFLFQDKDNDGIYNLDIIFNPMFENQGFRKWTLSNTIDKYPQYSSNQLLVDALYTMSLEELEKLKTPEELFDTGAEWSGVWTRDMSYSIVLALAYINPTVAKACLMEKVKDGKIIQDTGTGGAWPVSSDRMTWALAAWEIYKVTGDSEWLETIFSIISKSAEADKETIFYTEGMALGESSFLDWREQTYPRWMQPADIYRSECLGTNAVHYQTYKILAQAAELLNKDATEYTHKAMSIKEQIQQQLWLPDKGYYAQYRYGRNFMSVSPRAEALGEAFCVLFDIAPDPTTVISSMPLTPFGVPTIFPNIPNIPPYHNNSMWPFVQAFWNLAAAKVNNGAALEHGLAAMYRAAALFLTNKENLVLENGDSKGTQVNSDRQLWSVAGNIAMIYKVFAGMQFETDKLTFSPSVPYPYRGTKKITNFKYRTSLLDITINGYGSVIKTFMIDGVETRNFEIGANIQGKHTIVIQLTDKPMPFHGINLADVDFTPETPIISLTGNQLSWSAIPGAEKYEILKNATIISTVQTTSYEINSSKEYAEYQVRAIDDKDLASFLSEPVVLFDPATSYLIEAEKKYPALSDALNFSGKGFINLSKTVNKELSWTVNVADSATYFIDCRYANGNGPINTENKCAIRSLFINGNRIGAFVFPQRGVNAWSDWGFSNSHPVQLLQGDNTLRIVYEESNENMNGTINQAWLDYIRIIKE